MRIFQTLGLSDHSISMCLFMWLVDYPKILMPYSQSILNPLPTSLSCFKEAALPVMSLSVAFQNATETQDTEFI